MRQARDDRTEIRGGQEICDRKAFRIINQSRIEAGACKYKALAERRTKHGFEETAIGIASKLPRGTFSLTFLLACLAALEFEGIRLKTFRTDGGIGRNRMRNRAIRGCVILIIAFMVTGPAVAKLKHPHCGLCPSRIVLCSIETYASGDTRCHYRRQRRQRIGQDSARSFYRGPPAVGLHRPARRKRSHI
jgi:hypothetical protein